MQKTLTITVDKKKIISKPVDFEAMCLINDEHNNEKNKGPLTICRGAVDYLFEGTEATQEVINALDLNTRTRLCIELWSMYVDTLTAKNE